MPIRTPKGRGAAYRPLWQWPLRSPGRLVGCLVALLALLVIGNALFGHLLHRPSGGLLGGTSSAQQAAPTLEPAAPPQAAPAQPTRLPEVPALTPTELPKADAPPAALTTATRWTQAWARHPAGTTTEAWVDRLRPYTTDEYLGVLATVDPSNVPATRVTGPARPILVAPNSVRVEIPTDAVDLVVLVVNTAQPGAPDDWKVAGYDRAQ
jgi:hypothetical protein